MVKKYHYRFEFTLWQIKEPLIVYEEFFVPLTEAKEKDLLERICRRERMAGLVIASVTFLGMSEIEG